MPPRPSFSKAEKEAATQELFAAIDQGDTQKVDELLAAGKAKINAPNPAQNNNTSLMMAIASLNQPMVEQLVSAGASLQAVNGSGETPLDIANELITLGFSDDATPIRDYLQSQLVQRTEASVNFAQQIEDKFFDTQRVTEKKGRKEATLRSAEEFIDSRTTPGASAIAPSSSMRNSMTASSAADHYVMFTTPEEAAREQNNKRKGIERTAKLSHDEKTARIMSQFKSTEDLNGKTLYHFTRNKQDQLQGPMEKRTYATESGDTFGVSVMYRPSLKHIANFYLYGLGKYGKEKTRDILAIINKLTGKGKRNVSAATVQENEKALAKLLIESIKTNKLIQPKQLAIFDPVSPRTAANDLNRLRTLLALEVTRRRIGGRLDDESVVSPMPMALAIAMSLKLVAQGKASFTQILEADAPYGVQTGSGLSEKKAEVDEKTDNIFDLYYRANPDERPYSKEGAHQILLQTWGGASDTSGSDYSANSGSESEDDLMQGVATTATTSSASSFATAPPPSLSPSNVASTPPRQPPRWRAKTKADVDMQDETTKSMEAAPSRTPYVPSPTIELPRSRCVQEMTTVLRRSPRHSMAPKRDASSSENEEAPPKKNRRRGVHKDTPSSPHP